MSPEKKKTIDTDIPEAGRLRKGIDRANKALDPENRTIVEGVDKGIEWAKKKLQLAGSLKNPFSKKYKGLDFFDIAEAHLKRIGPIRKVLRLLPLSITKPVSVALDAGVHLLGTVAKTGGKVVGGAVKYPVSYIKGFLKNAKKTLLKDPSDDSTGGTPARAITVWKRLLTLQPFWKPIVDKEYGGIAPTFWENQKKDAKKALEKAKGFIPNVISGFFGGKNEPDMSIGVDVKSLDDGETPTHHRKRQSKRISKARRHLRKGRAGAPGSKAATDEQEKLDALRDSDDDTNFLKAA